MSRLVSKFVGTEEDFRSSNLPRTEPLASKFVGDGEDFISSDPPRADPLFVRQLEEEVSGGK